MDQSSLLQLLQKLGEMALEEYAGEILRYGISASIGVLGGGMVLRRREEKRPDIRPTCIELHHVITVRVEQAPPKEERLDKAA